jgi:hypothetical protein
LVEIKKKNFYFRLKIWCGLNGKRGEGERDEEKKEERRERKRSIKKHKEEDGSVKTKRSEVVKKNYKKVKERK